MTDNPFREPVKGLTGMSNDEVALAVLPRLYDLAYFLEGLSDDSFEFMVSFPRGGQMLTFVSRGLDDDGHYQVDLAVDGDRV